MVKALLTAIAFLVIQLGVLPAQDCTVIGPIDILPQQTTEINLSVSGLINTDLATDQAVCGINLVFTHNQLENIRITLTSPDGDEVILVGPGTLSADLTSLIIWDIAFNPCANPPAPHPGFSGQWDNNQAWSSFNTYNGVYHPFQNCLEDFDSGSANGIWQIEIENLGNSSGTLEYFELIFCNTTGTSCSSCFLNAGSFTETYEIFCESDERLNQIESYLDNQFVTSQDQSTRYILTRNDSILEFFEPDSLRTYDLLTPGTYSICGLAFADIDSTELFAFERLSDLIQSIIDRLFCGDITNELFTFEILESNTEFSLDTMLCIGDTIFFRDLAITDALDTIISVFDTTNLMPFVIECDSVYHISVSTITIDALITGNDFNIECGNQVFLNGTASNSSFGPITQYSWTTNDGELTSDIGPITQAIVGGDYILQVSDGICQATDTVTITQQDTFAVQLSQTSTLCFGDTIYVDIQSEFLPDSTQLIGPNILFENPDQFAALESGQYVLNSFFGSCAQSDTIELVNDAAPIDIVVSYDTINCEKNFADFEIMTNVNNPNITFSGPTMIPDNVLSGQLIVAGIYFVTVTDENGCTGESQFEIIDDTDNPEISLNNINISCEQGFASLTFQSNDAISSVAWSGPQNFSSSTFMPQASLPGTYYLEATAANGCTTLDSLQLTVTNETILFNVSGPPLDCINLTTTLCIESGQNLDSVAWLINGSLISNLQCIEANQAEVFDIEVYDDNGCFGIQQFELISLVQPVEAIIDLDDITIFCDMPVLADGFDSELTQNTVYSWTDDVGNIFSSDLMAQLVSEGTYYLNLLDTTSNCADKDSIIVTVADNPFELLEVEVLQASCIGDSAWLSIDNYPTNVNFDIFVNDNLLADQPSLFFLPFGENQLEIVDENTCTFDTLLMAEMPEDIGLNLGEDLTVPIGATVDINAQTSTNPQNIVTYEWSHPDILSCTSCLNPQLQLDENLSLTLEITNTDGCKDSDQINLFTDNTIDFFVPNIFTPDGDGDNDILTIFISDQVQKIFDFQIIDRWGNLLIFHPEIAKKGSNIIWDGSSQGKFVEDGVYVYVATLLLLDNTEQLIFGNITVLK